MTETTLDQHMAIVGRVVAKFISTGLIPHTIDSRGVEKFLGTSEDKKVFEAVIIWMLNEGIIRAKNTSQTMDGTIHSSAVQLTAKGLAIVKQPLPAGDTIEKRIQTADSRDWSGIGELIGGIAGGFAKAMSSGG